jgi:hypothetical protein
MIYGQKKYDTLIAWSTIGFLVTLVIGLSINVNAQSSQQSGTACVNGSQYCENNSLETENTTTTTNTNTNNNTNSNTNLNTNNNTNLSTNTNTNLNTNNNTSSSSSNNVNTNTNNNNNTSTSTSNVNSTVNQNVTNASTSNNTNVNTSNNTNVNTSTSDSNVTTDNKNVNQNNNISDNTNRNINESNSTQTINQNVRSKAPPASAIAPSIMSYSQDLCTVGRSGAFQGQVFGFSTGATVTDKNCERLKLSKYLYDTGMKVASVSILCQDERVFKAMEMAGTPCPYQGQIGKEATKAWAVNASKRPDAKEQEKLFIQQCTNDRNPNRDKINKDVVGAVKVIYTAKTKTKRQCKKEFYATQ